MINNSQSTNVSSRKAWYIVLVLTCCQTLAIADRYLLAVFTEQLKLEMSLSDAQLGLLMGPAFLCFYSMFAIPMGLFADSLSRRNIIAAGIFIWSAATAAIALATDFKTLVVARMLVGLGEACLLPAAMSLIAACFSAHRVARATSVFSLGGSMGKILAFIGGAALYTYLASLTVDSLALWGVSAWRAVFIYAAIFGVLLLILVLSFSEPKRNIAPNSKRQLLGAAIAQVRQHPLNYCCLFVAISAFLAVSMSLSSWAVAYFLRTHGLSVAAAGTLVGIASMFSLIGTLTSGSLIDRLSTKGFVHAPLLVLVIALSLIALFSLGFILCADNFVLAAASFFIVQFCVSAGPPAYLTALQRVTPEICRATVFSMVMVVVTLVGGSVGPTIIGVLADTVFSQQTTSVHQGLAWAMTTTYGVFGFSGAIAAIIGFKAFTRTSQLTLTPQ